MFIQVSFKSVPHCNLHRLLGVAFRPTGHLLFGWPQGFLCGLVSQMSPSTPIEGYMEFVADLIVLEALSESCIVLDI